MADETIMDVFNSMTEKQKKVVYFMVGEALASEPERSRIVRTSLRIDFYPIY